MYYLCALSCIIMYWFYRQSKRLSCWYMKFARPFWTSGLYVRLFEVIKHSMILRRHGQLNHQWWPEASTKNWNLRVELIIFDVLNGISIPTGSMYAVYGNIYHQYAPNVSIYTIHGSYGEQLPVYSEFAETHGEQRCDSSDSSDECAARGIQRTTFLDQVTENIRKPWENTKGVLPWIPVIFVNFMGDLCVDPGTIEKNTVSIHFYGDLSSSKLKAPMIEMSSLDW